MAKKEGKTKIKSPEKLVKNRKKTSSKKGRKKTERNKELKIKNNAKEIVIEKTLFENFVSLQKVLVNLSLKVDSLTKQISTLLELFEISAKALVEKDYNFEKENKDNKKIIEKIDNLLDQNKIIAKGMTLMHENLSGQPQLQQRPPMQQIPPQQGIQGYQKSIASQKSDETAPPRFKQLPKM
ncbi:MAG: hypothetical protein ABH804_03060 [archaeon]